VKNPTDRSASTLIQQHLGGGMSSVLFDQIREKKGWAYTVYANAIQFLDSSVFTLYAGVKTDRVLDTIKVFHQEIARISREGIPPKDLKRIKDSLIYSFELLLENSESRMMSISTAELFFKRGLTLKAYEESVKAIRVSDTRDLVRTWVKDSDPSVLVLCKKPKNRELVRKIKEESLRITKVPVVFEG
jgi:predicted Zn-dependent peptidase